jgi:N-methylhydantoinase A
VDTVQAEPGATYRVGVDVGGTFTDVVLVEETSGAILIAKVPTVPGDPSEGCVNGIDKALAAYDLAPSQLRFTVHGTTIATNTIIEGKGARGGLITSAGFRDVLEIAYQTRPKLYDVFYDKPAPLIPRYLCRGVPERITPFGETLVPLDEAALLETVRALVAEDVQSVAVAFLHSYKDPTHERRAGALIAQHFPDLPCVLSSDVCPEYREYTRTSTAVVNAVLLPVVGPYIARLEERIAERGVRSALYLMTSAGGIMASSVAQRQPVHMIESGPAGGVIGATYVAMLAGYDNLLALDVGGTTSKAALVLDGEPQIADEFEVGSSAVATVTAHRGQGYPVRTPVISLVEVGAAGGSIAHVDPGGALAVGPISAGAVPGPVCYRNGGEQPTITDCCLVRGWLNAEFFLGGETSLDAAGARAALQEHVAEPLGMTLLEAAEAVVEIAIAKIASALYFVSVQQGRDPRDFVLVASGGAGPMLVAGIGRRLGVGTVLIPPAPGVNSALGLLATDLRHEVVRTVMSKASELDPLFLRDTLVEIAAQVTGLLREEGVNAGDIQVRRELDVCYYGQSYSLKILIPQTVDAAAIAAMSATFHDRHESVYGFASRAEELMVVNIRVTGIGEVDRPYLARVAPADDSPERARKGSRMIHFSGADAAIETPLYDRTKLAAGDRIDGPAVIEQMDTTTVVLPEMHLDVDTHGNLLIHMPVTERQL